MNVPKSALISFMYLYKPIIKSLFPFLLLSLFFNPVCNYAQVHQIKVLAKSKGNMIWIRWAPSTPYLWELGNKYGYIVERYQVLTQGKFQEGFDKSGKALSTEPVKPYSEDGLKKLAATEEKAEILSEILYGKDPSDNKASINDSPASLMKKNHGLDNKFGMGLLVCDLSRPLAISAGLMWYDKFVFSGNRYAYRVRLAQKPKGIDIEDGIVVVDALENEKPLIAPDGLMVRFDDKSATLKWPVLLHRGVFTAYIIEKSTDGKNFKAVIDLPYTNLSEKKNPEHIFFVDSLAGNDQVFYYRIKGLTPFAEASPPSKIVKGQGKEPLEAIVVLDSAKVVDKKNILVHWRLIEGYEKYIKGYYVSRSAKPEGPFTDLNKQLLTPEQRSFIDKTPGNQNYYRIKYVTTQKDEMGKDKTYNSFIYLAQVADETPPATPTGLKGKVDTSGVVSLEWIKNKDADWYGYRVFRANSLKEEFVEITKNFISSNFFRDTINISTLTKKVYYRVVAIDRNINSSDYSAILTLNRPDKIPPSAALFEKVQIEGNAISLQWISSVSDDVARYELFRKDEKNNIKISQWPVSKNKDTLSDSGLTKGMRYKYELKVIDSAGNATSTISKEVLFENGIRNEVTAKALVNKERKSIVLRWNYSQKEIIKFVIYRSQDGKEFFTYKTLEGNIRSYEDQSITLGNQYYYKIKAFMKGGVQSEMAKSAMVTY